jgi:peptide/nickel transport system ATP-binding protein
VTTTGCRFHTRCEAAQDICKTAEPPLRQFGASHLAACHFPLQPVDPAASELVAAPEL